MGIFVYFWEFFGIFLKDFLWRNFLGEIFGRIFLGGFFGRNYFEEFNQKLTRIWCFCQDFEVILSQWRRRKKENLNLRSAIASTSHLKKHNSPVKIDMSRHMYLLNRLLWLTARHRCISRHSRIICMICMSFACLYLVPVVS